MATSAENLEAILETHSSTPSGNEASITALNLASASLMWRATFRDTELTSLSLIEARILTHLSLTKISSPTRRIPVSLLHLVLVQCAGTLVSLELDEAVMWEYMDVEYDPSSQPVDLVALKTLSLGYRDVREAMTVMSNICIPSVDTLSLHDRARDLLTPSYPSLERDATGLLHLIAQKKEASEQFCVRLSLRNVVFQDAVIDGDKPLASYFLHTVCAADVLKLIYDEDLARYATPFITAMGDAGVAVGTRYVYAQGVDYSILLKELTHRFVRPPGDDRPRDEDILEPAKIDVIHSDLIDPEDCEEFIRAFVSSGVQSKLRVRSWKDETETGTRWEPLTLLAPVWHRPIADRSGVVDPQAYRPSRGVERSDSEQMDLIFELPAVRELVRERMDLS